MKWIRIYTKFKDTESMKEFLGFWSGEEIPKDMSIKEYNLDHEFAYQNIKDIWGYLLCFAETKGYMLSIHGNTLDKTATILDLKGKQVKAFETTLYKKSDEVMLWCADKFFEIN